MYFLLIGLIIIAALLLCFVVMIQNSKGGGLAAGFSSSNQVMGVRKTTDFLEKATWGLAGTIIVLSIFAAKYNVKRGTLPESQIEVQMPAPISPTTAPDVAPNMPIPTQEAPSEKQQELPTE